MKTALFVDFDNAYLGLERLSYDVAARFGQGPRQWLRWLAEEFPCSPADSGIATSQRRVLIRRCYLNPVSFARFRRPFLEAGFDVVDCPPMTAAGKTSTDVHMVLDMVDALQHPTGFDEFIVFSADADFSPVLRRLRTNNRQTVVFAAGNMSEAYRASADIHIDVDTFIFDGLGFDRPSDQPVGEPLADSVVQAVDGFPAVLRKDVAKEVERIVKTANDPVPLARLAADLNRKFGNLATSRWLGAGSFSDLLGSFGLSNVGVDKENQLAIDLARASNLQPPPLASADTDLLPMRNQDESDIKGAVVAAICDEVSRSEVAVKYVRMAQILGKRFPGLQTDWLGFKTFRSFVSSLSLGSLQLALLPNSQDRAIYDPSRHSIDGRLIGDPLVASIFQAAKLPQVPAVVFCSILNVFWATLKEDGFDISASSAATHNLCLRSENSPTISLQVVSALLQGLIFGGFDPRKHYPSSEDLMVDACAVILAEWARENMVPYVDNDTRIRFMDWVNGGAEAAIRLERVAGV